MRKLLLFVLTAFVFTLNAQAQDCPRIFTKGDTLFTDPAPQYQWFRDNNPIQGATKQWYLPTKGGNFSVRVSGSTANFAYELPTTGKTVSGRIIDERYEPIADALISVDINNVKSDAQGRFFLTGLDEGITTAIVTITKDGFWKNTQRVHFFDQTIAPLTTMLEPLRITNRFDAQKGATISERGFFLTFPPNSAVTESGQIYTGTINISLKRSFPAEDGFGLRMPGGDFSAIDQNGQEKILVSYGFMSAEMQGSNGEKLKLAPNVEATLEFYIPWEQNKTAPDSMPLWHFDETNAVWKPEGIARKVGPRYVGAVKHFSSWNCDVPKGRARCRGRVRNCKKKPVPYVTINVGQRTVTANTNGEYTSFVPSETVFDITASVDSVIVSPLVESEEKIVKDLEGISILHGIGIIDTNNVLTVYGAGIITYSIDNGRTFIPKSQTTVINSNRLFKLIVTDSVGCTGQVPIYFLSKITDCQQLAKGASGLNTNAYRNAVMTALKEKKPIHSLTLEYLGLTIEELNTILRRFPCLHLLKIDNNLTEMPMGMTELFSLIELDLSGNNLITISEQISNLSSLTKLDMTENNISAIPEQLCRLKKLKSLFLKKNSLSILPDSITQLPNLEILNLAENKIISLPNQIGKLKKLNELRLYFNQLTELPESIGQLSNLTFLEASANQLTSLPSSISKLTYLQYLYLNDNKFDMVQKEITELKSLQYLTMGTNELQELPPSFSNLNLLMGLYLPKNKFQKYPDVINRLPLLEALDLSYNQLKSIPDSIGNLKRLKELNLRNTQLTALPESIGQLIELTKLSLQENELTELPVNLWQLGNLGSLNLRQNKLTEISDSIGNLKSLYELTLNDNKLTKLPATIANLQGLQRLYLTGNPIPPAELAKIRSWLPNTEITF